MVGSCRAGLTQFPPGLTLGVEISIYRALPALRSALVGTALHSRARLRETHRAGRGDGHTARNQASLHPAGDGKRTSGWSLSLSNCPEYNDHGG